MIEKLTTTMVSRDNMRYPTNQELMDKINELIMEINEIKKLIEPASH